MILLTLFVHTVPYIDIIREQPRIELGEDATYLCVINGTDRPRYPKWRDPSQQDVPAINTAGRGDTAPINRYYTETINDYVIRLVIPKFQPSDEGLYTCYVGNRLRQLINIIYEAPPTYIPPTTSSKKYFYCKNPS